MTVQLEVLEVIAPYYVLQPVGTTVPERICIPTASNLKVGDILTCDWAEVQRVRPTWLAGYN